MSKAPHKSEKPAPVVQHPTTSEPAPADANNARQEGAATAPTTATPVLDESQPGWQPKTPEGLPPSQVVNTPNPALPPDTDVGTLEQPRNTGTGDTPAPGTPGSAPGPDRDPRTLVGTGPQPVGGQAAAQADLPPTPTESQTAEDKAAQADRDRDRK